MRKIIYYITIVITTLSCSEKKAKDVGTKPENPNTENIKSDKVLKAEATEELENNSDCIFDDDYKKITAEWLGEVGVKKYTWDSKSNKATFLYNGDTLTAYKGGCNHFISSVEINTDLGKNQTLDSTLLRKLNDVACKFKFNNYCKKLIEGRFVKNENSNSSILLEFEDDDSEDNLISEGIQISKKGKSTIIEMSEYYN